jgi:hypothetical protein
MRADSAILLTRLGRNGDHPRAEPRQGPRVFNLISSKLKHLHLVFTHLSGLRQRCDEPRAKSRHHHQRLKTHAAASGFLRGGTMANGQVSGVNACREIAENIPQSSHRPVTFRWACA